ncbi:MAG: 50S ribosomal protein L18 [Candidatus Marinimicrobia bacterium]|nr:50S ribosomal protein L18 [Candidatus Neomarinimicrobiota bacterium]
MDRILKKRLARLRRKKRVSKKVFGTSQRPRLVVYRSLKHIYAQLVNDEDGKTILGVSDLSPEVRTQINVSMRKIDKSRLVGKALARKALEHGIRQVVFDRNGYKYHGRVKALADAAREGGLQF